MADHPYCSKETEIAQIHTKVDRMEKELFNGEGLVKTVPLLAREVERFNNETLPDLKTGMSGLLKYQQEQEGKQEAKDEMKVRNRWLIGILVGVIVALVGGLVGTIHLLLK